MKAHKAGWAGGGRGWRKWLGRPSVAALRAPAGGAPTQNAIAQRSPRRLELPVKLRVAVAQGLAARAGRLPSSVRPR